MSIQKPILLDFPMPIQTERLILRPLRAGDGKTLFDAVEETRLLLEPWMPWVKHVSGWEDSEYFARQSYAKFILRESMNLAIFCENNFIGVIGFNNFFWNIPSGVIGYWCRASCQRKGFMREATAAVTVYAFQVIGLKRVTILCNDDNQRSIQIPENLGFHLETHALGLIENAQGDDLVIGRRYVRFDCSGLN